MSERPRKGQGSRGHHWFKIGVNLVMIFIGMELIEYAYATQYAFSEQRLEHDLSVLKAMYIAFIAGLFPNYASTIADELYGINLRSVREIGAVLLFLSITFALNVAVIYVSLHFF
jgi:hypothetical protein